MRLLLLILFLFAFAPVLQAQSDQSCRLVVEGKVIDANTQEPLIGATILIKQLDKGCPSNTKGNFRLHKICEGTYLFEVRMVGYKTLRKEVHLHEDTPQITFNLTPNEQLLQNLIVEDHIDKTSITQSTIQIDKDFLLENQATTFVNSISELPGIQALNTGVGIAKPVIRGMSMNRVAVNDAGIRQEEQQWGADHGLLIDPYSVEAVEIVKGASALRYGAEAIGGVINILPPAIPESDKLGINYQANYQGYNHLYGNSIQMQAHKNNVFASLQVSHQSYADYRVPAEEFNYNRWILPLENGKLKNTAGRELNFKAFGGFRTEKVLTQVIVSQFNQRVGLFPGAMGIPRAYQLRDDGDPRNIDLPSQDNSHFRAILNQDIFLDKQHFLHIEAGFQRNVRLEKSLPHAHGQVEPPAGNLALGLDLDTYSLNVRWEREMRQNNKLEIGIQSQYQQNRIDGFEYLIPNYESASAGLYALRQWQWHPHWQFEGGLRFDYAYQNSEAGMLRWYGEGGNLAFEQERSAPLLRHYQNFSTAWGLSYQPSQKWEFSAQAGSMFRVPNLAELTANGIHHGTFRHEQGDASLEAERGIQLEMGLHYKTEKMSFELTPFANFFSNYLFLRPMGIFSDLPEAGQLHRYSQGRVQMYGGELVVEYRPTSFLSLYSATEYVWNKNLDTRLPLPFSPPFSSLGRASLKIAQAAGRFSDISLSLTVHHFAAQNRVDRNELPTAGYTLVHAQASTYVQIKGQKIGIFLQLRNLTNQHYINHLSRYKLLNLPEPARFVSATLRVPLSIKI
ncbi:MAG: TonB-dependent receptor [Bernardetiaceae bacterium]|nr:TonB-dependent receptor [Bernardetiaceae bacterium]